MEVFPREQSFLVSEHEPGFTKAWVTSDMTEICRSACVFLKSMETDGIVIFLA